MSSGDLFDLTGVGVGVTGGGGHLGREMAFALASAGAIVVICGRRQEPLDEVVKEAHAAKRTGRVVAMQADVSSPSDVERVLARIDSEAGSVGGWVNNAYSGAAGRLLELSEGDIDEAIRHGLTEVILTTRSVIKRMVDNGGGSIVNIASMYGTVSPDPAVYQERPGSFSSAAYGAAKAGLIQFTRHIAAEFGHQGVRANAISPGPFPSQDAASDADFARRLSQRTMLGRIGEPREIGPAVVFLISAASSFVTGHDLAVDGGWTAW